MVQVGLASFAGPGIYMAASLCVGPLSDKFVSWTLISTVDNLFSLGVLKNGKVGEI